MSSSTAPRLTVAIPLFRSAPFVDNISANLEALPGDAEILISDRHGEDDAIERIARRHAGDRRLRFFSRRDRVDWVDHLNALLREARGKYWRFMPHDDWAPAQALPPLWQCLDAHPETLVAYGPTVATDLSGGRLPDRDHRLPHPIGNDDPWTFGLALDLFDRGHFSGAFKGLWRLGPILERELWIRRTLETVHAERVFLAALALVGRFRFVEDSIYYKRFHASSTHARWRIDARHESSVYRTLVSYVRDLVAEPCHAPAEQYLWWTMQVRLGRLIRPEPMPGRSEPMIPASVGSSASAGWVEDCIACHRVQLGNFRRSGPLQGCNLSRIAAWS